MYNNETRHTTVVTSVKYKSTNLRVAEMSSHHSHDQSISGGFNTHTSSIELFLA